MMSAVAEAGTGASPRKRFVPPIRGSGLTLTAAICGGLVIWGGAFRDESDLIAEEGLGYALGIVGLATMTLLLTYSFRKRMPVLLARFSIRRWFDIHMMMGLAGPTAILFHCNFHLGSLNSSVALISALVVSASGVVGRFMYTRIHHGLLGDLATLGELHEDIKAKRLGLSKLPAHTENSEAALVAFEEFALAPKQSSLASTARFLSLGSRLHLAARACRNASAPQSTPADRRAYRVAVHEHLIAVQRAAEFGTYAWIFSLWHALHLPLCVLLFTAAAIHVLAVNLY